MTAQGSARTRFRRALRSADPLIVLQTASDVDQLQIVEVFAIVLVLASSSDPRFDAAARRLVGRVAAELEVTLSDTTAVAAALAAVIRPRQQPAAACRAATLLEALGVDGAVREYQEWLAVHNPARLAPGR
jgi:hypothetical protein